MCNARAHLEEQISRQDLSDSEKFQQYMIYLKYEQSSGDPGRVQLLYERAITDFPVSSDLWLDYTRYLDKTLKVGNVVRDVYSRATKNCPWVGELWVRSLLSLECGRAYEEEISTVFGKSLRCAFSTFEEYLDVLLARIDGLRRRILFSSEVEGALDYSLIRETFQCASDYLSEQMKNTNGLLRLYAYWCVLNKVWEKILVVSGRGCLRSVVQCWKPGKVIYLWKLNWVIQGQVQGMASEAKKEEEAVCVTGANGFIGTWLVKTLLDNNYTSINATVFPGSDSSHLFALPGAGDANLRVFEADVLDSGAVSRAVEGCKGVFHVASPCTLEDPVDPEKELILPAVQGTLNVLEAAKRFGVRRVVVTSSISAIVPNPGWKGKVFDETSWTDLEYCKSRKKWYPVSKTLAEKAAWEFAEKHGVDVVAIHPATCLGPLMQPYLNASCAVLQQLLQGSKDTQEYHWLGAVHVKDVAKAQVLLFESPAASGRYLCTNGIYQFGDFAERVSKLFPEFPVHRFDGETQPGLIPCKDAAKRLMDLGLVFTPVEDAVRETVESLKAKGFLGQHVSQS